MSCMFRPFSAIFREVFHKEEHDNGKLMVTCFPARNMDKYKLTLSGLLKRHVMQKMYTLLQCRCHYGL